MNNDVATARVKITVDIRVNGSWGKNCTIGQLVDQASSGAINNLNKALADYDIRVIGNPEVSMVTHLQPKVR